MISIIITSAFEEHRTIGKAIESILNQNIKEAYEIIVVTPDKKTQEVVAGYKKEYPVKIVEDPFLGKPYALNLAFKKAKGEILILTDGDVYLGEGAISSILEPFKNAKIGIVSGRPISLNPRFNKWGYFSHLLTDLGAHETRILRRKKGKMIVCSGYLYALRKKLIPNIPKSVLSEDAIISHMIYEKGYETVYAPNAKVYVKYPDNLQDWLIQKKRSAGGYNQINTYVKSKERMRSFTREAFGILRVFKYPESMIEAIWTVELAILRLYLWMVIYLDVNVRKKELKNMWLKVDSSK